MKSPFPGMDPYLEQYWRDVHHSLCTYARDALQPQIRPALFARIEERSHSEKPHSSQDEDATEGYIQIIDPVCGKVVAIIDFLSVGRKTVPSARDRYFQERSKHHGDGASIVEIDLLRGGEWIILAPQFRMPPKYQSPYRVSVCRASHPDEIEFYHAPIRERLFPIPVPLQDSERPVLLDLQLLIDQAYENGAYEDLIDYRADAAPPLEGEDAVWAESVLKQQGRR